MSTFSTDFQDFLQEITLKFSTNFSGICPFETKIDTLAKIKKINVNRNFSPPHAHWNLKFILAAS
jgi:hypothetical protein